LGKQSQAAAAAFEKKQSPPARKQREPRLRCCDVTASIGHGLLPADEAVALPLRGACGGGSKALDGAGPPRARWP
jgi:hypothetical protein